MNIEIYEKVKWINRFGSRPGHTRTLVMIPVGNISSGLA